MVVERINVAFKTALNRVHAVLALLFWIISGFVSFAWIKSKFPYAEIWFLKNSWIFIIIGIIIGLIRAFIILDKYSWQVTTIEEIRDVKKALKNMGSKINNDSNSAVPTNQDLLRKNTRS